MAENGGAGSDRARRRRAGDATTGGSAAQRTTESHPQQRPSHHSTTPGESSQLRHPPPPEPEAARSGPGCLSRRPHTLQPCPFRGRAPGRRGPNSVRSIHEERRRPRPVLPSETPTTRFPGRPDWPDPQSQSLSRSYGSRLPISLTYINLSTRGCEPRRPDAEIGTVCVETGLPGFGSRLPGRARPPRRTAPPQRSTSHRGHLHPTLRSAPECDPWCDFLTYIFHGLVLAHGTTQELCRSTATVWFVKPTSPSRIG